MRRDVRLKPDRKFVDPAPMQPVLARGKHHSCTAPQGPQSPVHGTVESIAQATLCSMRGAGLSYKILLKSTLSGLDPGGIAARAEQRVVAVLLVDVEAIVVEGVLFPVEAQLGVRIALTLIVGMVGCLLLLGPLELAASQLAFCRVGARGGIVVGSIG